MSTARLRGCPDAEVSFFLGGSWVGEGRPYWGNSVADGGFRYGFDVQGQQCPCSILSEGGLPAGDFGADVFGGGGTGVGAGAEGSGEVEDGVGFGLVGRVDLGEVELVQGGVGRDGFGDGTTDEVVGLAEGDSFADEPVCEVGGEEHRVGGGLGTVGGVDGHGLDHLGVHFEGEDDGIDAVEERFLVLLKVAVVGEGEAFEGGEEGHEVTEEAAGFPTRDLGDVGILLLRHQGAAGGVGVGEGDEVELGAGPEDKVFGKA